MQYSSDQQAALQAMTSWYRQPSDEPFILKGPAGTGKSTLVGQFLKQANIEADSVLTLATSGIAVQNIYKKSGGSIAKTIAAFLKMPQRAIVVQSTGPWANHRPVSVGTLSEFYIILKKLMKSLSDVDAARVRAQFQKARQQTKAKAMHAARNSSYNPDNDLGVLDIEAFNQIFHQPSKKPLFELSTEFVDRDPSAETQDSVYSLIVVDEVGMVSTHDLTRVLSIAAGMHTHVLGVGDDGQLPPVKESLNPWITLPSDAANVAALTTVHRQGAGSYLVALDQYLYQGVDLMPALNQVQQLAQSEHHAVNDVFWGSRQALEAQGPDTLAKVLASASMVITPLNRNVQALTQIMRRYKFGLSNGIMDARPLLNDRVMVTLNEPTAADDAPIVGGPVRLVNGMTGQIVKVHPRDEVKSHLSKAMWKLYDQLSLLCVDILFDDMDEPIEELFINTAMFNDPRVNERTLENRSLFREYPRRYHEFADEVLNNQQSYYFHAYHHDILYLSFGYVLTVHKAQGREWDCGVYYEGSGWFGGNQRALRYTAVSRFKRQVMILTE